MFLQNGKIHVGYKDLMENYQIVVNNLAAERGEKDTNLVLNVFQSLLDEFTRSYTKTDFEPTKVGSFTPTTPILSKERAQNGRALEDPSKKAEDNNTR